MKDRKVFSRLMNEIGREKVLYIAAIIIASSSSFLFNTFSAYGLRGGLDGAIGKNTSDIQRSFSIMVIGLILVMIIIPIAKYVNQKIYILTVGKIKKRLYDHVQHLPMTYYESHQNGEFISKFNNDMSEVKNFYGDRMQNLLTSLLAGIGTGIFMFMLSVKLSIYVLTFGIVYVYVDKMISSKIRSINKEIQEMNAESTNVFSNIVNGFSCMKSYNAEDVMKKQYKISNIKIYKKSMQLVRYKSLLSAVSNIFGSLSFVGAMVLGSFLAFKGEISIGTVIGVIQLENGVNEMFQTLGDFIVDVQKSYASAERVYEIFDNPVEKDVNDKVSTECDGIISEVVLDNVGFKYENREFELKNINVNAQKGQSIAFVGSSGSGKSTIFKLLMRFYSAASGKIFIGGKDINEYSLEGLRGMISCVEQESHIFEGTIAENIGFGKSNASRDEIVMAAKLAYADEFIKSFSDGYDTLIGEKGVKLSGGQKQRISIARAFLKNSPILLLDEATSALDSDSETKVQKALEGLMKGRTVISIAHRLSTIINSDRIYVVKNGRIIEEGTHKELLSKAGEYNKLYSIQFSQV